VRQALVPGLEGAELESGSFYELLERRYGITIVGGAQTVEPTVTNEEESELLGVPLHSPAFLFERVTRSAKGDLVEYVRSIYRGDRYRLVSELGAAGAAGRALTMLQPATESGLDNWYANMPGSARGQLV
jgi:GntR family transcriptional regulator